jgi:hypothetical protein
MLRRESAVRAGQRAGRDFKAVCGRVEASSRAACDYTKGPEVKAVRAVDRPVVVSSCVTTRS